MVFVADTHNARIPVPGHDLCLAGPDRYMAASAIRRAAIYLQDGCADVAGLRIWGSPWIPEFWGAFNLERGAAIREHWSQIPEGLDILVTHGPPRGFMDDVEGAPRGCADLLARVQSVRPRVHAFGHAHEGRGIVRGTVTTFVNCAAWDEHMKTIRPPTVLDLPENPR